MKDAIRQCLEDRDKLRTLAHVMLSALEENQEFLFDLQMTHITTELRADNSSVIRQAKEILLDFKA